MGQDGVGPWRQAVVPGIGDGHFPYFLHDRNRLWATLSGDMLLIPLRAGDDHCERRPEAGYYNLTWNRQDAKGRTCACGIYFCTMSAENQRFSRKVILTE
jgi:hypothetical protein